jgi:long-subunit acyl-CoA synthetase (AMP-forming)
MTAGMTETAVLVTAQSEHDISRKTSGSLLPGIKAKIINADGLEVKEHDKSGELLIQSPALVLGYLNNEKATTETFVYHNDGRWIRTGDEGLISMTDSGNEHVVIVDRIKELIKVKVRLIPKRPYKTKDTYRWLRVGIPSCSS